MNRISVLDCTLRDGGYCNSWNFGERNIHKIINGLVSANVDIIECGYLTNKVIYSSDSSMFTEMGQLAAFIPKVDTKQMFVAMINFGEYDLENVPDCKSSALDGIRIAFHKKDFREALNYCKTIKEKGYRIFIQPMVTMSYTDQEFIELIEYVNEIAPYAFYIVDSFGTMKKSVLMHYLDLVRKNLLETVAIGFHSHNNFQSAFSNAMCLLEEKLAHELIIDAAVYGMGRGAGNLNSELFLNELNVEVGGADYSIKPLLQIMDEVLNRFYEEKPWGYSLPNYLSEAHMIHPNYALFLCEKNTLTIGAIDDIFAMLDPDRAVEFDLAYIEKIYEKYMSKGKSNNEHMEDFRRALEGRKVLLIAPGKTAASQYSKIMTFIEENLPITVSINHEYEKMTTDYIFTANMRRFRELPVGSYGKTLVTTNIKADEVYMCLDYYSLVNSSKRVRDNAGLMAVKLMINMGCEEIWLAGFDGYDYVTKENYENRDMELVMSNEQIDDLNDGIEQVLKEFSDNICIHFVTDSKFVIETKKSKNCRNNRERL